MAGAALAAPAEFWTQEVGKTTPGARGVAVAPESAPNRGHVFVADQTGRRVVEFTAWGELVKAWGWDVVATGPGESAEDKFEICVPAAGDVCQAGLSGTSGVGQFNIPVSVAVDASGNVYVVDSLARRMQKFSPGGEFLLMVGGGVNQGGGSPANPGNLCTKEHLENGDTCGAASAGTAPGQFGALPGLGNYIAIAPGNEVWIGDVGRIQRFDTDGGYQSECPVPGEIVSQVSAGPTGHLYVSYFKAGNDQKPDVRKLDPDSCAVVPPLFEAGNPRAISVSADGDVYVFDKSIIKVRHFDEGGKEVEAPFGEGDFFNESIGLATSSACGIEGTDVFFGNANPSFVRAYGPPPDPSIEGCEQPQVAPQISAQYASSVGTDSATVEAQINPNFWQDATYYVEYGTADCAISTCKRALFPGAPLTDEVTDEPVAGAATLGGLAPGTTYHFRFVAESGGGGPAFGADTTFTTYRPPAPSTSCPNQDLRSGASAALPDCRAYEMVSPVEKNGGEAMALIYEGLDPALSFSGFDRTTPGGSRLTFTASAPFAEPQGASALAQYLTERGEEGWETRSIDPPLEGGAANGAVGVSSQFKAFSEDLCTSWLTPEGSEPQSAGPEFGYRNVYRREGCGPSPAFTWLQSSGSPPEPCVDPECTTPFLFPDLQGTTPDGRCAAFRVNDALPGTGAPAEIPTTSEASEPTLTARQLYVWCEDSGVRLASVLPSGAVFAGGDSSSGTETITSNFSLGEGHVDTVERAFSQDGTLLYWTASGEKFPQLYLRVNADSPQSTTGCEAGKACTLQVSSKGFGGDNKAQFWTASSDGTRAIFSITDGFDEGNIYEYAFNPATSSGTATKIAGDSLGVAGSSEDATRTYLASEEVCSGAQENSEGDVAQAGGANLYLHEVGESCAAGELEFIGTLAGEDVVSTNAPPSPVSPNPRRHTARASADGAHLVFVSAARLTAYDNTDRSSGKADREVYLYDAEEKRLLCASCNPTGARPAGADLEGLGSSGPLWTAAWIPGYQQQLYGRRLLSEDGNRLYFNAVDALALRDTNGAQDVYQWEAPGSGTCTTASTTYSAQNEGCIDLISTGKDARDAEFVEASASGDDIFFRTEESLLSSDPGAVDIYDARVGGGFPDFGGGQEDCEGEGCQSPAPAPQYTAPSSLAFQGPGDPPPPGGDCSAAQRRAAELARRAKRLREASRGAASAAKARRLRQARRLARQAKAQSNRAARCRQVARRAAR